MSAVKASSSNDPKGGGSRLRDYFSTLKYEWQKISWPDKVQWRQSTIVVFVFVLIMIGVLVMFDAIASFLLDNMLGLRR